MPRTTQDELIRIDPEEVFKMNPAIRWVGLTSEFGAPIFTKMREGVISLTPEELDRTQLAHTPYLMMSIPQELEPWYGKVKGVVTYHDKLANLFVQLRDRTFLVLAFEGSTPSDTIRSVNNAILSKWGRQAD